MTTKPLSDELFKLLKSLSAHEAGYLSAHIKTHRNQYVEEYVNLVTLLRSAEAYEEEVIKKACRSRDIKNRFSYHKGILYDYVLQALIACHAKNCATYSAFYFIESAEILCRKSLFIQALKLLDKAHDIADCHQKYSVLLQVVEAQRRVLKQTKLPDLKKKLEANSTDKQKVLLKINNENDYADLNDNAFMLYREYEVLKTDEKLKGLDNFIQSPLLQNKASALTFDASLRFHYIHSYYHQLKGNYSIAVEHRKAAVDIWVAHPQFIDDMPERFRTDISNLLSVQLLSRNYQDFENLLKRMECIKTHGPEEDAATFREVYHLRQVYFLNTGRKEEALQLIPQIEKGLKRYGDYINPSRILSFYFNIISVYFVSKRYHDALTWTTRLIDEGRNKQVRVDLVDFASVLEIILQYETGKHSLVEYRVRNARARLKKNNKLYEFEEILLLFINRLILCEYKNHAPLKKQQRIAAVWLRFLHTLQEFSSKPSNIDLLGLEEITIWVTSKVYTELPAQ